MRSCIAFGDSVPRKYVAVPGGPTQAAGGERAGTRTRGKVPSAAAIAPCGRSSGLAARSTTHFLAAVVPQLAYLLDEDVPVADVHQFNALWQRAVARAAETHRHLLLMVDGLDENTGPPRVPSVAMLLPLITGSCGHVLVAGRPHPELPVDVPVEHPLRALPPTALQPFAGHEKLKGARPPGDSRSVAP